MPNLGGWEIVIILGVLVLLFGAKKLPDMARSIGQSARVFKGEMKGLRGDDEATPAPKAPEPQQQAPQAPPAPLPPAAPVAAPQPPAQGTPQPSQAAQQGPSSTGQ
jgi:sec-independent protein translocase protein TatA